MITLARHAQLTAHLHDFVDAYNYGRRLKALKSPAPFEHSIGEALRYAELLGRPLLHCLADMTPAARAEEVAPVTENQITDADIVDDKDQLLYTFQGLGKNACCYLTELGLSDAEVSAIAGETPETFRHYAKR